MRRPPRAGADHGAAHPEQPGAGGARAASLPAPQPGHGRVHSRRRPHDLHRAFFTRRGRRGRGHRAGRRGSMGGWVGRGPRGPPGAAGPLAGAPRVWRSGQGGVPAAARAPDQHGALAARGRAGRGGCRAQGRGVPGAGAERAWHGSWWPPATHSAHIASLGGCVAGRWQGEQRQRQHEPAGRRGCATRCGGGGRRRPRKRLAATAGRSAASGGHTARCAPLYTVVSDIGG